MFESSKEYKNLFKDFELLKNKIALDAKKKLLLKSSSREEGEAVWEKIDRGEQELSKIAIYRNITGNYIDQIMRSKYGDVSCDTAISR
jgi:hypothetical protein